MTECFTKMVFKIMDGEKKDDQDLGISESASPEFRLEKCDLCGEQWDPGPGCTRLVYCYICGKSYDLKCWGIQRTAEIRRGEFHLP